MHIISIFEDKRINSTNVMVESTYKEYLELSQDIMDNNEFQRRRVRTSKTIYSLLKSDLIDGCVMPSIVLAYTGEDFDESFSDTQLFDFLIRNKEKIIILDGLQRTYTLVDAENDISPEKKEEFLSRKLRIELYVNINKFGVLYRMLTLNTGQTPMSTRHQLEMLYSDLLNTETDGVKFIQDKDGKADPAANEFIFKNMIEGFNAYITRDELPMDRVDILDNIKMLENISEEAVNQDLFKAFVDMYLAFFRCMRTITDDYTITSDDQEELEIHGNIIGKTASKIFSTSQALTGFGAAVGIMKYKGIINSFVDITNMIEKIPMNNDCGHEWMLQLVKKISDISQSAKKIGNSQRAYFVRFYRELFTEGGDAYLHLNDAVETGYKVFLRQE